MTCLNMLVVVLFFWPYCGACGILLPELEIEPKPPQSKCWVLITVPQGNSLFYSVRGLQGHPQGWFIEGLLRFRIGYTSPPIYVLCSVTQFCLTLPNPMNCSLPGSSVCGVSQARMLEWVPISFSITPRVTPRVTLYCSARIHARISKGKGTWGEIHKK